MNIVFDSGESIRIHYDIFLNNGLRRGDDLSSEAAASLLNQSDLLYAKESALRILGLRSHSIKELNRKLLRKQYNKDLIEQVIDDLCNAGYLDDAVFTRQFAHEKLMRKNGIQKIKNDLISKGVSREIINQVLAGIDDTQERENAVNLAIRKAGQLKVRGIESDKVKQKVYAFLISKGYGYDMVRSIIDEMLF